MKRKQINWKNRGAPPDQPAVAVKPPTVRMDKRLIPGMMYTPVAPLDLLTPPTQIGTEVPKLGLRWGHSPGQAFFAPGNILLYVGIVRITETLNSVGSTTTLNKPYHCFLGNMGRYAIEDVSLVQLVP